MIRRPPRSTLFPTRRSSALGRLREAQTTGGLDRPGARGAVRAQDRKSTRLNSSHQIISYAVFCLKKKKEPNHSTTTNYTCTHRIYTTAQVIMPATARLPNTA